MPTLETPPNPAPTPDAPAPLAPPRVRAGRFGELEQHELLHLLDSIDDERSRGRFRESIYISFIVYLALAWFVFYGPKVLFHQGRIISVSDALKQRDKELTYLDMPRDLSKLPKPKSSKILSDKSSTAQTAHPTLDKKTLEQLQAMRKAGAPAAAARPPLPETPQAQPQPQPEQPQQPPQPRPQPALSNAVPDAPRPTQSPTRPNFSTPTNPGQSIQQAANDAARAHGNGGNFGASAPLRHQGEQSSVEVLSDTMGVDFGPYIKKLLRLIRDAWYPLIPEECYPPLNKEGKTLIRFTIEPNGRVSYMGLDGSTHDVAIDKAAWGSINGNTFPPLPQDFKGENLQLRIQFIITRDASQAQ